MPSRTAAMVFPGQGSQRPDMLATLPLKLEVARLLDAAEALTGLELRAYDAIGSLEDLTDTRVAQPLLYLADWAWGTALAEQGLAPAAVAGHSLGEYAALAVAGVFSVEAGLQLVVERASRMAEVAARGQGGMAAVIGLDREQTEVVLQGIDDLWVANDNCPGQQVVSGSSTAIDEAADALTSAGARRVVRLNVSGPFHTPLMSEAERAFGDMLDRTELCDAGIPVVQNAEPATASTDAGVIRTRLASQMTSPVRWASTMETLKAMGVEVLVEAGPGSVLRGLARRVEHLDALSVEDAGISAVVKEVCV